jgi:hypothetical protein
MPNARILPDTSYVNVAPLPATWWQALDLAQSQSITEAGGSWNPSSPIVISGAGVWLCGPSTHVSGNGIFTASGSGKRVTHGDSDWVSFKTPHIPTRNIVTSVTQGRDASFGGHGVSGLTVPRMQFESAAGGLLVSPVNTNYLGGGRIVLPLSVHHNAGFLDVVLFFTVSAHSGVPLNMPVVRVLQVDQLGNVTIVNEASNSASPAYTGNGFISFFPSPASGTAWHAAGAVQQLTYSCSGRIDTANFSYLLEIVDESGTNSASGNEYLAAIAAFDIFDMRPQ